MEIFERVKSGEKLDRIETVFISKDGREIYVEGNASARFKNAQGRGDVYGQCD
ncbi:MAG TPA: hypothetical protein EYP86_04570 [Candidatus Altiarchaeales archaeon]|nr:hypothetical protein [Candidatus Altiarchaeales archaeon]